MRTLIRFAVPAAAAFAAFFFTSREAAAGPQIGADVDLAQVVGDARGPITSGFGFDGRFGYRLGLPLIAITPEVGVGYMTFSGDQDALKTNLVKAFVGARVGFGAIVTPTVYGHLGYGWASFPNLPDGATTNASTSGALYDLGLALDLRLIPHITPGLQVGYNSLVLDSAIHWVNFGIHAEIEF